MLQNKNLDYMSKVKNLQYMSDKKNWMGIDGGFGYMKITYYDDDGKLSFKKFLSVLAYADNEHKFNQLVEYKGNRYWLGSQALLQPTDKIHDIKDYSSLKKHHTILLHHAIKLCGKVDRAKEGKLNIVIGLSAAHSEDKESFLKENIDYTIDGTHFVHNSIIFQEQAGGAIKALNSMISRTGQNKYKSFLVVDGGFNTLDIAQAFLDENGIFSSASLGAHEGKGFVMVAEQIRGHIMKEYKQNVSLKEATQIIEDGKYDLRGVSHDLKATISKTKKAYSRALNDFLEKKYGEYFDKSPQVFFVGGVAYFIDENIAENFKVVDKAEYYNALGYLLQGIDDFKNYRKMVS